MIIDVIKSMLLKACVGGMLPFTFRGEDDVEIRMHDSDWRFMYLNEVEMSKLKELVLDLVTSRPFIGEYQTRVSALPKPQITQDWICHVWNDTPI